VRIPHIPHIFVLAPFCQDCRRGNLCIFLSLNKFNNILVLRERIELSTSPLPKELGCANTLLMFKENSLFWRDVPPGFPREAC